jgi:ATP-binding cassette, subfamily C, bacterial CydD
VTSTGLVRQTAAGGPWFRAAAAASLAAAFGQIALFYAVAAILSSLLDPRPAADMTRWIVTGAAGLAAQAMLNGIGALLAARGAEAVERATRVRLLPLVLSAPAAALGGAATSRLLLEEPRRLADSSARWQPARLQAALVPAAFVACAFAVNWLVGLLLLLAAPLIPLNMAVFGMGAQRISERQATQLAELDDLILDRIKAADTLRALRAADGQAAVVRAAAEELARRTLAVLRIALGSSAALEAITTYAVAVSATYIGLVLLRYVHVAGAPTSLDLRGGLFLLLLAPAFFLPFRDLAAAYHDRQDAEAASEALSGLLSAPDPGPPPLAAGISAELTGQLPAVPAIRLRGVGVCFPDARCDVLGDVDWDVPRGALAGVAGPSGAGKTTLLRLIAGRLAPTSGSVSRGGPGGVAWVGQRPYFFQGTIADNLRIAAPDAAEDALWRALREVGLADVVAAIPGGLSATLTWQGGGLSGGQAHRVAVARALLSDAGIVLLDEPTAHLDPVAEAALIEVIAGLVPGRTVVVASHSAAVLGACSDVLVVGHGQRAADSALGLRVGAGGAGVR